MRVFNSVEVLFINIFFNFLMNKSIFCVFFCWSGGGGEEECIQERYEQIVYNGFILIFLFIEFLDLFF